MQSSLINTFCRTFHFSYLKHFRLVARNSLLKSVSSNLYCGDHCRSVVDYKRDSPTHNNHISQTYVNFKILRLIKGAIREYGPIRQENKKLDKALKRADEYNVPIDFVNFALKISVENRAKLGIYEILYLNHGYFIIQYEDVDNSNVKHHLLKICERYDAHIISGQVKWDTYFNPKGVISVEDNLSKPIGDVREAEILAKKIGAQSAKKELDIDGWISWRFYCEPGDLHKAKGLLQEDNYEVEEAYVGLVPKRKIPLPMPAKLATHSIICKLSEIPFVDNLYTNIML